RRAGDLLGVEQLALGGAPDREQAPQRRQDRTVGQPQAHLQAEAETAGGVEFPRALLSLTLAYSCGVSECIFHSVPDMARNFYTVSARPGHERNLIVPDFAAHGRDRVAEGQDRFWIPCSGSRLELS